MNKQMPTDSNIHAMDDELSLKELVLKAKEWFNYFFSKWAIIQKFQVALLPQRFLSAIGKLVP